MKQGSDIDLYTKCIDLIHECIRYDIGHAYREIVDMMLYSNRCPKKSDLRSLEYILAVGKRMEAVNNPHKGAP